MHQSIHSAVWNLLYSGILIFTKSDKHINLLLLIFWIFLQKSYKEFLIFRYKHLPLINVNFAILNWWTLLWNHKKKPLKFEQRIFKRFSFAISSYNSPMCNAMADPLKKTSSLMIFPSLVFLFWSTLTKAGCMWTSH